MFETLSKILDSVFKILDKNLKMKFDPYQKIR